MIVTCPKCDMEYDDLYRLTYCPHQEFEMHTTAVRGDGTTKVCRSIEELNEFTRGKE